MDNRIGRKRARSVSVSHEIASKHGAGSMAASSMRSVSRVRDRSIMGLKNEKVSQLTSTHAFFQQKIEAFSMHRKSQRKNNLQARAGEADRHIPDSRPKHLLSGKRGMGTNDRR